MTRNRLLSALKPIRKLLESLGPPIEFRKLRGILNALEMQVEDGLFQPHAVARLCEAFLATAELYVIDEETKAQLQQLTGAVIDLATKSS